MSGKTFGKEHLSEKIRQIRKNENFSDESFYDEMKKNLEGKKMENKYTMEVHNTVMKNIFLKNPQYVLEFCSSVFCLIIIMIGSIINRTGTFALMATGIIILIFLILRRSEIKIRKLLRTVFEDEFANYIIKNRYKIFYEDFWKLKEMSEKIEYGNPEENFYLRFRYYLTVELQDEIKEKEQKYKKFLKKYGEYNEK